MDVGLAVLAVLPYLTLYLHHYIATERITDGGPTGFILGDLTYYSANARAIFERGNGISYPNPFDYRADAPAIYFHWFLWILGFGIVKLGFDPGVQFACLGIMSAAICAWITLRLVAAVLPDSRYRTYLYLLTMWGGGILCLIRIYDSLINRNPWDYLLFWYDPFEGWFFLYWGRTVLFTTEATYHILTGACWLAMLRNRWGWGLFFAALVAATHPFTGLQMLLILLTWSGIEAARTRFQRAAVGHCLVALSLLAAFALYYGVYLESFPEHRAVRSVWSLYWVTRPQALILAYGGVGFLAAARLLLDWRNLDRKAGFLVVCFAISFLLSNHHYFLSAHQPVHFTRGYVWMPLCLLALPLLQRMLIALRERWPRPAFAVLVTLFTLVAVSDNAIFLIHNWLNPDKGFALTASERDMLDWINRRGLKGALLSADKKMSYAAPTFTATRPFYGHWSNTPHFETRMVEQEEWFREGKVKPWLYDMDYFLVPRRYGASILEAISKVSPGRWRLMYENQDFALVGRDADNEIHQGAARR